MKKSIMLMGSFSGGNYGDSIVLTSLLSYLEEKSFTEVYIPSASPVNTEKLLTNYSGILKVNYIDINMRRTYGYRFFNTKVIKSLKNIDYLAFTAGTIFFRDLFNPRKNFVFSVFLLLLFLRNYKIKLVGLFVGINEPILEYKGFRATVAKIFFNSFSHIISRDYESFINVKNSYPDVKISRSYDIAFYDLLKRNKNKLNNDLISVSNHEDSSVIGLNICEYLGKQVGKEVNILDLKFFLETASKDFNKVVWFHTTKMDEEFVKNNLLSKGQDLSKKSIHLALYEDLSHEEEYENIHYFIGMRMHSIIPALAFKVPCIALNYNDKVRSLFRQLDGEMFALDLDLIKSTNVSELVKNGFVLDDDQRAQIIQNVEDIEI